MKEEDLYWVGVVVVFSATTLLAAALVLVSLTAPESGQGATITGIAWLIISLLFVFEGIRRKPLIRTSLKPWLWLTFSLFWFFMAFSHIALVTTPGLAKILTWLIYLVVAVFCLLVAIVKRRDARSMQEDK